jgi:hypothetical protein
MTYKGYLQKTQEGWGVLSNLRNEVIPLYDYIDPNLLFYNGRKVEFEVLQIDDWFAKLVWQERDKPHVEKLAEEVYGKGVNYDYEEGYVDGYNKAKETLYTKEQVIKAIDMARLQGPESFLVKYKEEDIIQSLKQPKKD